MLRIPRHQNQTEVKKLGIIGEKSTSMSPHKVPTVAHVLGYFSAIVDLSGLRHS